MFLKETLENQEKKKASPSLKKKNPIKWHSRSSHKMPDNVSFQ